jgi:yeast amino acid transporter
MFLTHAVITIFFVGLIVPSNSPDLLLGDGNASESPFVIAAKRAGIPAIPSIVNAVVLTSAWSAGNSSLLWGSRILYAMAVEGRAPKVFTRINRFGIPYLSVLFYGMFMALGYMSLSSTADTVFSWLKDLVSISTLVNWMVITVTYLRFYYGCRKQGIDRRRLPWAAPLQPYMSWWSLCLFIILLLTGGFSTFIHGQYVCPALLVILSHNK